VVTGVSKPEGRALPACRVSELIPCEAGALKQKPHFRFYKLIPAYFFKSSLFYIGVSFFKEFPSNRESG